MRITRDDRYKNNSIDPSRHLLLPAMPAILLMGAAYTWLDMLQPPEYLTAILAFIPALVSLLALRTWQRGFGTSESFLRFRPLSLKGGLEL